MWKYAACSVSGWKSFWRRLQPKWCQLVYTMWETKCWWFIFFAAVHEHNQLQSCIRNDYLLVLAAFSLWSTRDNLCALLPLCFSEPSHFCCPAVHMLYTYSMYRQQTTCTTSSPSVEYTRRFGATKVVPLRRVDTLDSTKTSQMECLKWWISKTKTSSVTVTDALNPRLSLSPSTTVQ